MTEPRIRTIRQVTERVDHRVISGDNLLVGQIIHDHMGNQLEWLARNRPTESPLCIPSRQEGLIVIILMLLGSLLWQPHQQFRKRWITTSGVNIKVQPL